MDKAMDEAQAVKACPLTCPNCGKPLNHIWGSDHYTIVWSNGSWHKEEDSSILACGECYVSLDHSDVEDALKAVDLL